MRGLALITVLAITGCHDPDRIEDMLDGDKPLIGQAGQQNTPVQTAQFRWDPVFGVLDMSGKVNGVDVTESKAGEWFDRAAGGYGGYGMLEGSSATVRGGGGRARKTAMPSSIAPSMPARDYAPVEYEEAPMAGDFGGGGYTDGIMPAPQGGSPLKAGKTDDNVDYDAFLAFLDTWSGKPGVAGNHVPVDVRDRRFVKVHDGAGNPLPGARISVVDLDKDQLAWSGTTYGDGVAPFYPHVAGASQAEGNWLVQAEMNGEWASVKWDGVSEEVALTVDVSAAQGAVDLDVVFLIDTTGSMSDEIARIKSTLLSVTDKVKGIEGGVDLRYGAVLYRDIGDEYLTRHTPLTSDVQGFDNILKGISANGGGDGPESLNQGLSIAVSEMEWRDNAAKLVFLVADAPPHMDYQGDTTYADASLAALSQGIKVHTVAASGLDDFGSLVFRQSAQLSRGQFVFIEYGSTAASAADHGVTGQVNSNNLDAILFEQIQREVEGWGSVAVASR